MQRWIESTNHHHESGRRGDQFDMTKETSEELKFEKALERLEKIVEELEAGNIPLEEALKKYEEGVRLSRACAEKLSQAEKKIQILTKTLDGSLKREDFEFKEKE